MCFRVYACVHTRVHARVWVHTFISTSSQRQFDDDSEEFIGNNLYLVKRQGRAGQHEDCREPSLVLTHTDR
jgi:hypothetical protein